MRQYSFLTTIRLLTFVVALWLPAYAVCHGAGKGRPKAPPTQGALAEADRLFNLGFQLSQQGDLDQAIAKTREAIKLNPNHVSAHNNLGWFLQQKGNIKEATAQYEVALRMDPSNVLVHNNLRMIQTLSLQECKGLDHKQAQAHFGQGFLLSQEGRLDDAIKETEAALRCDPKLVSAHNNLGWFLQSKGRVPEAVEHYRTALSLEPSNALAANNLRAALAQSGGK